MPQRPPVHRAKRTPVVRPSAAARGYGHRWQQSRAAYLADHPLCCRCQADGRTTAATVVDHVVPHKGDAGLFWDRANWEPLCKSCHDRKTATEDGGFGRDTNHPRR